MGCNFTEHFESNFENTKCTVRLTHCALNRANRVWDLTTRGY